MLRKSGTQRRQPALWRRCRSLRQIKQVHTLLVLQGFLDLQLRELLFASAVAVRGAIAHAYHVFEQIRIRTFHVQHSSAAPRTPLPWDAVFYARMSGAAVAEARQDHLPFVLRVHRHGRG
ncbi:hypothetical protein ZWY2020_025225 [Hordeum vulgare]|nr:hypothetical protein ZWY2020_025225 [Hordeum vulgare]